MSLFRIGANIQAMDSLRSLYGLNEEMGARQARLASGKRINTARDDTAGYAIARSLEARKLGLGAALSNVQNAQSILAIAEGGYQNQMDILQTIKEKAVQASDRAVSDSQRTSIDKQVYELLTELDEIGKQKDKENKKEIEFSEKIDELNQETDTLLEEIDKWQM